MNLFDLFAKISLDSSGYEEGLSEAESKGKTFGEKLKSGLGTAAKVGGAAIAAIGTAAVSLGKSFYNGVSDLAAYGDQIDKNSQKMGISAKAYQEWDFVLQHSGSSIDAMSRGMTTLSKQAETNNDAFAQLGITEEDLATLNKEDLFAKTIEGLQAIGEGTKRDVLAAELFGGSAKELGPLLNTTADEVANMKQQVSELGGVMSDQAVKDAAAFQDSIQNLQTSAEGIKRSFLQDFMPSITGISDGLTSIFSGDIDGGLEKIQAGVDNLVNKLTENIPKFLDVGFKIVEGLGKAITKNAPTLMKKGAELILNDIIPGIIENLPELVTTGFQIIGQLATSIGEALPELIPAAIQMIFQIVDTLLSPEGIDLLIDGAISLIMGLADGIISALPILIQKAPEIIIKLVEAIIRNAPKLLSAAVELIKKLTDGIGSAFGSLLSAGKDIVGKVGDGISSLWEKVKNWGGEIINKVKEGVTGAIDKAKTWGRDLIQNFISGITEKWEKLKEKVSGIAQGIKDFLGFSEPKKGPLSDFHTYAPDMMDLFAKGIEDNKRKLQNTISGAFDFGATISAQVTDGGASAGRSVIFSPTININGGVSNAQQTAQDIMREMKNIFDQEAAAYGI